MVGLNLILLVFLTLSCNCKQNILSNNLSEDSSDELVQLIVFYRHGNYQPSSLFYTNEYSPYDLSEDQFFCPTYLGNSQSWSFGQLLKTEYPELLAGIDAFDDTIYVMGDYDRSISNAKHISCGLFGNYPDWDYETISSIAISAIQNIGYCTSCDSGTYVPVSYLADNDVTNTTSSDIPLLKIESDENFFDVDDNCDIIESKYISFIDGKLTNIIYNKYGLILNKDDVDDLAETLLSETGYGGTINFDLVIAIYDSHLSHELSDFTIEQADLQAILEQDDIYQYVFYELYDYMFSEEDEYFMAKLYDAYILESITEYLYGYAGGNNKKLVTYMMHDNNLFAMTQLLMGSVETYPNYSSDLRLHVYKSTSDSGETTYYVNGYYLDELFTIDGCSSTDCPITEFYDIISGLIVDVETICEL